MDGWMDRYIDRLHPPHNLVIFIRSTLYSGRFCTECTPFFLALLHNAQKNLLYR